MIWWKNGVYPLKVGKCNFLKIIDFYLFKCPVQFHTDIKVSARGETFESRGITEWRLTSLLREVKSTFAKETFIAVKSSSPISVEQYIDSMQQKTSFNDAHFEFVVFNVDTKLKQTKSLFYAIRNAFAHGSFSVCNIGNSKKVYYLENKKKGLIKARMRLKEETLINWINLVEKHTKK